jgi:formate dehydrogenase subunit gamma
LRTDAIPAYATPLTAEQATNMLQLRIKKHHVAIMLLHWFNAFVWLFELVTGLALVSSPYFRVVPEWFVSIVEGVFGSRSNMLEFHVTLGLVWIFVFLVYGIFGFRTYLGAEVLKKEIALDRDDFRWLIVRTLRILGRSKEPLPPQGSYNAGQKLFAFMIYAMIPLVMISGLIMSFQLFSPAVVGWAIVVHFAAVGAVVSGLMVHVYMGAVFPEEKSAFFSMVTGTVDELYAYNHHFKWWREVKLAQREWEHERDQGPSSAADSGAPAPADVPQSEPEPPRT